jgi:uncharacterized Zn finger protein
MSYYEGGWPVYVTVAERRKKAEKAAAKAKKRSANYSPIEPFRGAVAKTFWGKAWCTNLEAYSDYANRMPRGRTYVRNGSVIHLNISRGEIKAMVMGSSLYEVEVNITPVAAATWRAIVADCSGSIDSLVALLQGKLSGAVMERICAPKTGLFPMPKEITMACSCPDYAGLCKHVAAVLYGVGARLEQQPEMLFSLRGVDAKDLIAQVGAARLSTRKKGVGKARVLDSDELGDVFGLEMGEVVAVLSSAPRRSAQAKSPFEKVKPAKAASRKISNEKSAATIPVGKKQAAMKPFPIEVFAIRASPKKKIN